MAALFIKCSNCKTSFKKHNMLSRCPRCMLCTHCLTFSNSLSSSRMSSKGLGSKEEIDSALVSISRVLSRKGNPHMRLTSANVSSWVDRFDTFIFDCDGVLWRGPHVIEGRQPPNLCDLKVLTNPCKFCVTRTNK